MYYINNNLIELGMLDEDKFLRVVYVKILLIFLERLLLCYGIVFVWMVNWFFYLLFCIVREYWCIIYLWFF